jgi:hypothetical protein
MNEPRRSEHTRSAQEGTEQTQRIRQPYPPYTDPAYSGQTPYSPGYYSGSATERNATHPTEKLPSYWLYGQPTPDQPPEGPAPKRSKAPRWLWIAATAAVLLVAALVIALVLANGTATKQTELPPLATVPSSPNQASTTPPSSSPSASASAPSSSESAPPTNAVGMQTVEYNVNGEGRAISITYVDNDGMMQTEFNVVLPWSKEILLAASSNAKARITIINIGHDVTCTLTVDGVEVNERTGVGLTVCNESS